jgi:hypothetical protein
MALERDPQTRTKAALLLAGAGRGAISEHGAQMAVQILEDNGFQIWEIKPDEPEEPSPPAPPPLKFGSKESLAQHIRELRQLQHDVEIKTSDFMREFNQALWDLDPVFEAIRIAMEAKETDGKER